MLPATARVLLDNGAIGQRQHSIVELARARAAQEKVRRHQGHDESGNVRAIPRSKEFAREAAMSLRLHRPQRRSRYAITNLQQRSGRAASF